MPNMTAGAPLIRLAHIHFRRNRRTILQDIDLSVCAGEIVTLIGPNGAGKSTLVAIALGLQKPDRGTLERRPGLALGYVPQKIDIDPAMPLNVRRFLQLERHPRATPARALAQAGAP
ncbi:MAG: ATP-binding cassette domain-containing protein, partial [Gammaproteobacteria bacterium]